MTGEGIVAGARTVRNDKRHRTVRPLRGLRSRGLAGEHGSAGARDKSANFWPLAILSFGESWHNLHHADPTCARHGVKRGQIDISARLIWAFEKVGWATNVRWPNTQRLQRISARK